MMANQMTLVEVDYIHTLLSLNEQILGIFATKALIISIIPLPYHTQQYFMILNDIYGHSACKNLSINNYEGEKTKCI